MTLALELFLQQKFSESLLEWQKLLECDASNSALHREIEDAKQKIWEMNVSKEIREEISRKLELLLKLYKVEYIGDFLQEDMSDTHKPNCPAAIAFDSDACLYVVEEFEHCIKKYSSDGKFITQFGSKGSAPGEFHYPTDIAIDKNNNLYITDRWNHRIQKFSSSGEFILIFDNPKGTIITEPNCIAILEQSSKLLNKNNHDGCSTLLLNKDSNQDTLIFVGFLGDDNIYCFRQNGFFEKIVNIHSDSSMIRFLNSLNITDNVFVFSHRGDGRIFFYNFENHKISFLYLTNFFDGKMPNIITSDDFLNFNMEVASPKFAPHKIGKTTENFLFISAVNVQSSHYYILDKLGYSFLRFIKKEINEKDFLFTTFAISQNTIYIYDPAKKQIQTYKYSLEILKNFSELFISLGFNLEMFPEFTNWLGRKHLNNEEYIEGYNCFKEIFNASKSNSPTTNTENVEKNTYQKIPTNNQNNTDIKFKLNFFRSLLSEKTFKLENLENSKKLFETLYDIYLENLLFVLDIDDAFSHIYAVFLIDNFTKLGFNYLKQYLNSTTIEEIDENFLVYILSKLNKFKVETKSQNFFNEVLSKPGISKNTSVVKTIENNQKKYYIREVKKLKFPNCFFNWVIQGFDDNTYLAIDENTDNLLEFTFDGEIISSVKLPFEAKNVWLASDKCNSLSITTELNSTDFRELISIDRTGNLLFRVNKIQKYDSIFPLWSTTYSKNNILYVCDYNDVIYKFTDSGKYIEKIGTKGKKPGQLEQPLGIFVDDNENIFVTEFGNKRLQVLDKNGNSLSILNFDTKYFNKPHIILWDGKDSFYIGGNSHKRFAKYNNQLELLYLFFLTEDCYVCDIDNLKRLVCRNMNKTEIVFYSIAC